MTIAERLCTAHRIDGEPCKKPAIMGGMVCAKHGGSIAVVKAKAQQRIDNAAFLMVGVQVGIALDAEEDARDRINAANHILNRSNLVNQPTAVLKHSGEVGVTGPVQELIDSAKEGFTHTETSGKQFSIDNVIEAEIVE